MLDTESKLILILGLSTIFFIWVGRVITEGLGYKEWFIQAFLASVLAFIPTIGALIKHQQTLKAGKKIIEQEITNVLSFVMGFVRSIKVDRASIAKSILKEKPELDVESIYDPLTLTKMVLKLMGIKEDETREYLGILSLCHLVIKRKATSKHITIIQNYISTRGLANPSQEEGKIFLTLYYRILVRGEKISEVNELNRLLQPLTSEQLEEAAKKFVNTFAKSSIFWYFQEKLHKSEELRQTLVILLREGKLAAVHVGKKALESMEKTLSERGVKGQSFLVIVNESGRTKGTTRFRDIFKHIPHIGAAGTATLIPGYDRAQRYALYLVKLDKNYPTLQDFVRTEIESHVGDGSKYQGVVAVYKLNISESMTTTIPEGATLRTDFLKRGYEILETLRRGEIMQIDPIDVVSRSEVSYEEIMSILPFNLLAMKITESERTFLVKNYDMVKQHFNVDKITDWKDKDPKELAQYLLTVGKPWYSKVELNNLFKLDDLKELDESKMLERYIEISKSITEKAKEYYDSLMPLLP
jgi:hypothetical protein